MMLLSGWCADEVTPDVHAGCGGCGCPCHHEIAVGEFDVSLIGDRVVFTERVFSTVRAAWFRREVGSVARDRPDVEYTPLVLENMLDAFLAEDGEW